MSDHPIEHNPGDHEDPLAAQTWTVSIVGVILLVVTILFVAAMTYAVLDGEREMKVIGVGGEEVAELDATQSARLTGPPRVELRPENGGEDRSIVIPVDVALEAYVAEASSAQQGASQ